MKRHLNLVVILVLMLACTFCLTAKSCGNGGNSSGDDNGNIVQLTMSNYETYFDIVRRQAGNNHFQTGGVAYFLDFYGFPSLALYKSVVITYSTNSGTRTLALNIGGNGSTVGSYPNYPVVTEISGQVELR